MNILFAILHPKRTGQQNFVKISSAKYDSGIASGRKCFAQKPLSSFSTLRICVPR